MIKTTVIFPALFAAITIISYLILIAAARQSDKYLNKEKAGAQ